MFSPAYDIAVADSGVQSVLGSTSGLRFYSFGTAPPEPKIENPYAVWQTVGGDPENYINQSPDSDNFVNQVDVFANTPKSAKEVVKALVEAFQVAGYVTSWNGEFREPETGLWRISFTVEFITAR